VTGIPAARMLQHPWEDGHREMATLHRFCRAQQECGIQPAGVNGPALDGRRGLPTGSLAVGSANRPLQLGRRQQAPPPACGAQPRPTGHSNQRRARSGLRWLGLVRGQPHPSSSNRLGAASHQAACPGLDAARSA